MEVSKCWKIVEFPKIQIKMENCKRFYEAQTASHLKEIVQTPLTNPPPDKILLRPWNKNFLMEIYRNIQTLLFKNAVLGVKQWQICKVGFWLRCGSILFSISSELGFIKWVRSRAKLYCKMSDLFCQFLLALRLSTRKSEIKEKTLMMSTGTCGRIKKLYAREKYFRKKKYEILNRLYLTIKKLLTALIT